VMKKALGAIGLATLILVVEGLVNKIRSESFALWIVAMIVLIVVPATVWLILSVKVFPSAPGTTWRDHWMGAALFGIGVELLHLGTVVWISRSFSSKSQTYGALGAALTILFWAYILGRCVTGSASLSAVLWSAAQPSEAPSSANALSPLSPPLVRPSAPLPSTATPPPTPPVFDPPTGPAAGTLG